MSNLKSYDVSVGTLYDLNKNVILQQNTQMSKKDLEKVSIELEDWFNHNIDGYAMLLCRERYDFSVFHLYELQNPNPCKIAVSELIDLLKFRGKILSIEKSTDAFSNAWEIWVKIKDEAFAYYLFPCDDWVIEC